MRLVVGDGTVLLIRGTATAPIKNRLPLLEILGLPGFLLFYDPLTHPVVFAVKMIIC